MIDLKDKIDEINRKNEKVKVRHPVKKELRSFAINEEAFDKKIVDNAKGKEKDEVGEINVDIHLGWLAGLGLSLFILTSIVAIAVAIKYLFF